MIGLLESVIGGVIHAKSGGHTDLTRSSSLTMMGIAPNVEKRCTNVFQKRRRKEKKMMNESGRSTVLITKMEEEMLSNQAKHKEIMANISRFFKRHGVLTHCKSCGRQIWEYGRLKAITYYDSDLRNHAESCVAIKLKKGKKK